MTRIIETLFLKRGGVLCISRGAISLISIILLIFVCTSIGKSADAPSASPMNSYHQHKGKGTQCTLLGSEKELMEAAVGAFKDSGYSIIREPHAIIGTYKNNSYSFSYSFYFYPSEKNGYTDVEVVVTAPSFTSEQIRQFQEDSFLGFFSSSFINTKLMEKDYDPNIKNAHGLTHLSYTALYGKRALAKKLIDKGADVDLAIDALKDKISGLSPADWSSSASSKKIYDMYNRGIQMLNELKPKKTEAVANTAKDLTREDIAKIVRSAVEDATKSQKREPAPVHMETDIDKPSFKTETRIFGDNDLAIIIGIEGYQSLPKSDYSYDDARLMKDYMKALGFKERNIELITDARATLSGIVKSIEVWLKNKTKPNSRVFVYYSGHGAPDPSSGEAYLVPYDGDPNYLSVTGYPLKRLYESLGKLPVAEVTVVIDACFSGAGGRSVLAKGARPLVMMTERLTLSTNMAVLSATQGAQISTSSPEKGHGIFTYYFLKALKDGQKNLRDIYKYMKPLVEDDAKALNIQQSPTLNPAPEKLTGRFNLRR